MSYGMMHINHGYIHGYIQITRIVEWFKLTLSEVLQNETIFHEPFFDIFIFLLFNSFFITLMVICSHTLQHCPYSIDDYPG